jgi:hypothetical protein
MTGLMLLLQIILPHTLEEETTVVPESLLLGPLVTTSRLAMFERIIKEKLVHRKDC